MPRRVAVKLLEWIGRTVGTLRIDEYIPSTSNPRRSARFRCTCSCGNTREIAVSQVYNSKFPTTCYCHREKSGRSQTPEYQSWNAMIGRCHRPNSTAYPRYGAVGVTVCDRWRESFANFLADMGLKPSPQHTIERKRNEEGYHPDNCVWATPKEQARNRRTTRLLTAFGRTQSMKQWAVEYGLDPSMFRRRLQNGTPVEEALTTPLRARHLLVKPPTPTTRKRFCDWVGEKVGRLTIRAYVAGSRAAGTRATFVCDCDCGTTGKSVSPYNLLYRVCDDVGCGCIASDRMKAMNRQYGHAVRLPPSVNQSDTPGNHASVPEGNG